MGSTEEDIRASLTSLESGAAPTPVSEIREPDPIATPAAPATPAATAPESSGPARDPNGRFAPATPAAPAAAATPSPTAPTAPAAPGAPAAAPTSFDPARAPASWRPEMQAKWSGLPEDVRQEIVRREEAHITGFSKFQDQVKPAQQLYDQVAQHGEYFQRYQLNPQEYIRDVITMEKSLQEGNPAQKMEALISIGEAYGVPLKSIIDQAMGGKLGETLQAAHAKHNTPPQVPAEVQRELEEARRFRQEILNQRAQEEYNAISSNKAEYPLFEEIKPHMLEVMKAGRAGNLKEAYDAVVWLNPEFRAKHQAAVSGTAMVNGAASRQAAAAAAVVPSPGAASPPAAPSPDEAIEDTIRRAMAASAGGGRV